MVRLTLIARVADGLPLAEGLDSDKEHDLDMYKSQAKVCEGTVGDILAWQYELLRRIVLSTPTENTFSANETCISSSKAHPCVSAPTGKQGSLTFEVVDADFVQEAVATRAPGVAHVCRHRRLCFPLSHRGWSVLPHSGRQRLPQKAGIPVSGRPAEGIRSTLCPASGYCSSSLCIHQVWYAQFQLLLLPRIPSASPSCKFSSPMARVPQLPGSC